MVLHRPVELARLTGHPENCASLRCSHTAVVTNVLTSPVHEFYTRVFMKSKREGNAEIGRIIERHMPLDKADELFSELSKVGGNAFRTAMTRVKRIIQKRRV